MMYTTVTSSGSACQCREAHCCGRGRGDSEELKLCGGLLKGGGSVGFKFWLMRLSSSQSQSR